ncbi:MAG: cytidylate kinase-like family protein [Firmicutes bacterium]|nr:cytidylate kinase-like family protein [Bacillota bacterium]
MSETHFAIAITRTCGSGGGSYIGKKLARDYGIDVYDRKLLRLAAEDSGINEKVFAKADENTRKTLLYRVSRRVYDGTLIPPESGNFLSDQNLFNYQSKVLRELLECESYVCIGRAADFVLRDKPNVLSVFLDAPYENRIAREMERQGLSHWEASRYIDRLDRYRESYYKYHTGRQWKRIENYDLCLDTAALGMDNCVELIKKAVELKFGIKAPTSDADLN